ncbi:MAG: dihydroorotate dehydrogenase electron transfer subunit [Deltaproteobacteria bacterium]|nr:dihydroorotate dehydrogenase electron transfer subunit [Deltaproteobacteria bacterium]
MIEQNAEIVFNKPVAVGTFFMAVRSPQIAEAARPGQFVMIRVGEGLDPLLRRPFSICGVRDDLILVLYRVVGRGTRIMSDMGEGRSLGIVGPLGRGFARSHKEEHPLLVAGGMGVAPLMFLSTSMAPEMYTLLAGFGSADQIVRADELGFSGHEMSIATDDGSAGHHGPVTQLLEDRLAALNRDLGMVFACGPLPMLKAVAAITSHRDIPCQVSLEATMACGLGACQGCAVKASKADRAYFHVCQDGPVFDVTALDWGAL